MCDTTPRPATGHLDVCGSNPPQRPYKVIALLTCEGAVDQEAVMTTAIFYRARQIGADGVINPGTINLGQSLTLTSELGMGGSARCLFQANAIVYTDK